MQIQVNLRHTMTLAVAALLLGLLVIVRPHVSGQATPENKFHPTLVRTLEEADEGESLPVAIWLQSPALDDLIPADAISPGQWQTMFAEYRARHRTVAQPVVAYLHDLGYAVTWSEVAPSVFAELPKEILFDLAKRQDVLVVYLQPQNRRMFIDTLPARVGRPLSQAEDVTSEAGTVRAPMVWNRGYEGQNAPLVAVIEGSKVDFANPYLKYGGESSIDVSPYKHTMAVAGVIASNPEEADTHPGIDPDWFYRGVAWRLGSGIYSAAYTSHGSEAGDLDEVVTEALDAGARVLNNSWGAWEEESCQQEPILNWDSIYFDYISRHYRVTVVTSVGNFQGRLDQKKSWVIPNPAWAYNVISVGGIDDADDADWANDEMWYREDLSKCNTLDYAYCDSGSTEECWGSVYDEGSYDREKPEVCAVATEIDTTLEEDPWVGRYDGKGTSFAAPAVAAGVALLMERDPTLETQPETVKAIIMASARHDVYPGTEHDGLGSIDIALADHVVQQGQFATPTGPESEFPQNIDFWATDGDVIRVVLTWASNPDSGYTSDPLETDFDLEVLDPDGREIAWVLGTQDDNNYLWLQFSVQQTGTYRIRVKARDWGDATTEPVGLAWARLWHLGERIYLPLTLKNHSAPYGSETIGWLAIKAGQGNWNGHAYEAAQTADAVTQGWYQISFGQAPRFVGASSAEWRGLKAGLS